MCKVPTRMYTVLKQTAVILVLLCLQYSLSDPCPSPCWCLYNNTTVVCNLTGITAIPKGLPRNTIALLLRSNKISHIPKTAFEGLYQLSYIDMTRNKLQDNSIDRGAFNLSSIDMIDLSANLFTSIPQELPPKLLTLNFYNNPISTLKTNSFVHATSIQYLNMLANQIDTVEEHAFDPLINVRVIDLSSNSLNDSSLSPKAFSKNVKLNELSLNYNQIQAIPDTSYLPSSLQKLNIYGNKITTIPSYAFKSLSNLTNLAVAQGTINSIEDNAFVGLDNLRFLDLTQGHLSGKITNLTFNGLASLQGLSLDINNVSKIEAGAFYPMKNLQELGLSENKLMTIEPAVLDTTFIQKLSAVYIYGNPWTCDCHLRWLREKMDNASYKVGSPSLTDCAEPADVAGKTWADLKPSDFVCK